MWSNLNNLRNRFVVAIAVSLIAPQVVWAKGGGGGHGGGLFRAAPLFTAQPNVMTKKKQTLNTQTLIPNNATVLSKLNDASKVVVSPTTKFGDKLGTVLTDPSKVVVTPAGPTGKYGDKLGTILTDPSKVIVTPASKNGKYGDKLGTVLTDPSKVIVTPAGKNGKYGDKLGDILKDPSKVVTPSTPSTPGTPSTPSTPSTPTMPSDPSSSDKGGGGFGTQVLGTLLSNIGGGAGGGGGGGSDDGGGSSPAPAAEVAQAQPAPVQTGNVDLVLEDIQLSQGATLIAGPAYRVKFRNQGSAAAGPFRVAIVAALDGQMTDAKAIVEVPGLAAGDVREVTLRLPASSMQLVSASSTTPTIFSQLVVAVDADNSVVESDKTNNVVAIERTVLEQ